MKKLLALTVSSLFLVACENDDTTSGIKSTVLEPSLKEIAGVWYFGDSFESEEEENEDDLILSLSYLVITESGEFNSYYYVDWNNINCYSFVSETITDLGSGSFEFSDSDDNDFYTGNFSIYNNKLTLGEGFTGTKSSMQESDLSPLCNEPS